MWPRARRLVVLGRGWRCSRGYGASWRPRLDVCAMRAHLGRYISGLHVPFEAFSLYHSHCPIIILYLRPLSRIGTRSKNVIDRRYAC